MSLSIVLSTKKESPEYIEILKKSSGVHNVEILCYENPGTHSLTELYNKGLDESKNDIVLFCHDDLKFDTPNWGRKLLKHFKKSDYGILGVAGTRYMPMSGKWWEIQSEMIGQVWHEHQGKRWLSTYCPRFGDGIINSVLVDGLFFAVDKNKLTNRFDEGIEGFHFYEIDFCVKNYLNKTKIGTISNIDITHLSIGQTNMEWENNRKKFISTLDGILPLMESLSYKPFKLNKALPLVSIIIPVYNYGYSLGRTLDSVFRQTYKNIEIIIVDDGSTDIHTKLKMDTLDIPHTTIIRQENGGPSKARNTGIKSSNGEYILPLDSDDMILPTYIEEAVNAIKYSDNISPVYCDTIHEGQMKGTEQRPEWSKERLLQGPFIVNCSLFSRKAFDAVGGFDESLKGWEDYDLWIRMMKNGYVGKRIPRPLFVYIHHESDGTVSTHANQNMQELRDRIMTKNGFTTKPQNTYIPLNNSGFNCFT